MRNQTVARPVFAWSLYHLSNERETNLSAQPVVGSDSAHGTEMVSALRLTQQLVSTLYALVVPIVSLNPPSARASIQRFPSAQYMRVRIHVFRVYLQLMQSASTSNILGTHPPNAQVQAENKIQPYHNRRAAVLSPAMNILMSGHTFAHDNRCSCRILGVGCHKTWVSRLASLLKVKTV